MWWDGRRWLGQTRRKHRGDRRPNLRRRAARVYLRTHVRECFVPLVEVRVNFPPESLACQRKRQVGQRIGDSLFEPTWPRTYWCGAAVLVLPMRGLAANSGIFRSTSPLPKTRSMWPRASMTFSTQPECTHLRRNTVTRGPTAHPTHQNDCSSS